MLRAAKRADKVQPAPSPTSDLDLQLDVQRALAALSPMDRALVWSQVVEGVSYRELSAIHGRPEVYLRNRCCRAKRRLATLLGENIHDKEGGSL